MLKQARGLRRAALVLAGCLLLPSCGESDAGAGPTPPVEPGTPPATPPPDPVKCRTAPYPIVLAHGMAGFERIGPVNYFFNVAADLRARGEPVFESQVSPYDRSEVRGQALAQFIDQTLRTTGACKVNLIAHSQGGIDGRYVISGLRYGDRIAALVTVGTPHRGTVVADVALGTVQLSSFTAETLNALLLAIQGLTSNQTGNPNIQANLRQLATDTMASFNASHPDDPRVRYASIAGRSSLAGGGADCAGGLWPNHAGLDVLDPLLSLPASVFPFFDPPLRPTPNDGLVSVPSARWGRFLGCVPADHFDEVGQIAEVAPDPVSGFYHRDLYRQIVALLRQEGS
jgi:triacylglycerol lipase